MSAAPEAVAGRSPLSLTFLLHVGLELPFAVQALWAPERLPFLDMTNSTIILVKLFGSMSLASCFLAFLCWSLPEFLPGKRAVALSLLLYHSVATTALWSSPRFIPYSLGPMAEQFNITPEIIWSVGHGFLSITFALWWQVTLRYGQMFKKMQ